LLATARDCSNGAHPPPGVVTRFVTRACVWRQHQNMLTHDSGDWLRLGDLHQRVRWVRCSRSRRRRPRCALLPVESASALCRRC